MAGVLDICFLIHVDHDHLSTATRFYWMFLSSLSSSNRCFPSNSKPSSIDANPSNRYLRLRCGELLSRLLPCRGFALLSVLSHGILVNWLYRRDDMFMAVKFSRIKNVIHIQINFVFIQRILNILNILRMKDGQVLNFSFRLTTESFHWVWQICSIILQGSPRKFVTVAE